MDKGKETGAKKTDLSKLKKRELLEIMLAQGKEIDSLRTEIGALKDSQKEELEKTKAEYEAQIAELKEALDQRTFDLSKVGSIAEASLQVTDIFKEAEKAAVIYLENIMKRYER